jgi:hypothetical protein
MAAILHQRAAARGEDGAEFRRQAVGRAGKNLIQPAPLIGQFCGLRREKNNNIRYKSMPCVFLINDLAAVENETFRII